MRTNRLLSISLVMSFLSLSTVGCAEATATGPRDAAAPADGFVLEGRSYDVTLAFPGETAVIDRLVFESGKFESTACTGVGFPRWSEYQGRDEHGAMEFHVVARHPDGTTMEWHGTADANAVLGTATRNVEGRAVVGSFRGSLSSS
jgi:hypothetical protein